MTTKFYYGCDELERGWDRYFQQCNTIEWKIRDESRAPTIKTLNSWRVQSPKGFAFVLHLDNDALAALVKACENGREELGADFNEGWERTAARAKALAAKAIIISTPMEVTPGATSKALLLEVARRVAELKKVLIWEPSGLWTPEAAREWASANGIVAAIDPFMAMKDGLEPGHGDACFLVNERAGMRRKFDQYDVENLIDWSEGLQRVFVLLRGRFKWQHAREFRYVFEQDGA